MTGFTDRFGGSTVQPSDVGLRLIALSANIVTVWPPYATSNNECARIMKVTPTAGTFSITLPDAMYTSAGTDIFFDNSGGYTFTVLDSAGGSVATIAAGQVKYLYLSDNSTAAGTWRVMLFGAASSNLDASQLAGSGLLAIGSTLAQASVTTTITSDTVLVATDRANLFVNTGGVIALTLPLTSVVGGTYFVEVRNQGTGAMTLTPVGGETIDGSSTVVLQINESCFVQAGSGAWYTVGHGRNQQFNFTQLTKTVTGGTTTLTLSEASNVVQTYSGTLGSAETLVLPAVVQVYYISNITAGTYSFTIKNPATGSTLVLPQGQSAVVFSDGTNVTNASTSVGGIASLLLLAGTAAAPSLGMVNANNGLFAPTGITVGVSANGAEVIRWGAGQSKSVDGTVSAPAYSFLNSLTTGWYSPAAGQIALAVAGVQKFFASATSFIINKVTITPPATGSTLTIVDGATLTASATASVSGTNTGDNAANTSIVATPLDTLAATTDITTRNASTTAHGLVLKAVAPATGLINFLGIAYGETVYSLKALFDDTSPATQAFGDSAAVGTAAAAARRDHKHAMMAAPTTVSGSSGSCTGNAATASAVAVGGITGLGTGIATALAQNAGTAGAPILQGGAAAVTTLSASGYGNAFGGTFTPIASEIVRIKQLSELNAWYGFAIQRQSTDATLGVAYSSGSGTWEFNASYASGGAYHPMTWIVSGAEQMRLTSTGLNSTVIGATTPAAGSFTTLSATDTLTLSKNMTATAGGALAIEAVIAPTLVNSWVNVGGTNANAGYWKDAFGVVRMLGAIQSGSPNNFCTLPVGYRPPYDVFFFDTGGHYMVTSAGVCSCVSASGYLDVIQFRTT